MILAVGTVGAVLLMERVQPVQAHAGPSEEDSRIMAELRLDPYEMCEIVFVAASLTIFLALTHTGVPSYLGGLIAPVAAAGWPIGAVIGRFFGFRMRQG
jgi:hypothetical protein